MQLLSSFSIDFDDVLEIETDKEPYGYIQFEAVSTGNNLNEGIPTRGTNCTSVDALIYAKHKNGEKWIIPIEWKYTEEYSKSKDKSYGKSGAIRLERYIALWAEQIIQKKKDKKLEADNYLHLHIIPNENKDLLNRIYSYSKLNMEDTWCKCIVDQDKYKIISPQDFLKNFSGAKYNELKNIFL